MKAAPELLPQVSCAVHTIINGSFRSLLAFRIPMLPSTLSYMKRYSSGLGRLGFLRSTACFAKMGTLKQ